MIAVNLKGGLGNQMFQFALYTKLQMQGKKVFLDISHIDSEMRSLQRCTIFDAYVLDKKYNIGKSLVFKIKNRLLIYIFKKIYGVYQEKQPGIFDAQVFDMNNGYIDGYWQSEKYFFDIRKELVKRFNMQCPLMEENRKIAEMIRRAKCPVALHIRLGDYLTSKSQGIYGNICTEEYYEKAISYIQKKYSEAFFFVFSNEPEKALSWLNNKNFYVVDCNSEETGWIDMYLMSICHHNIIANSTFSWWAAWLNDYPHKEVIAPKIWLNTREMADICPNDWQRI